MKVKSTLGVKGVLDDVVPAFELETGATLALSLAPTVLQERNIREGERADVAILTREAVDRLIAEGVMLAGSRVDLARSKVGLAVRKGSAIPDISTQVAVVQLLMATPSIVYSKAGASGIFFTGILDRLRIRELVDAKATIIPAGFTAELVASGKAALAVQQLSELMAVDGVDIVGPLPAEIQDDLVFSAGLFACSERSSDARKFLNFISGPRTVDLYREKGLFDI